MNSEILEYIGIDPGIILIAMAGVILLLFILLIVNLAKTSGLKKKYRKFMEGRDGNSLEDIISNTYEKYDEVSRTVESNSANIEKIISNMKLTYQKMGIIKYDAFNEMGGKLSFSLALLYKENN